MKGNRKKKILNILTLKKSEFQKEFEDFYSLIQQIETEVEIIDGKRREYVYTAQLKPYYKMAFKKNGLVESAIKYRISIIDRDKFTDDFIELKDTRAINEPKYVINRLNKNLLIKLYLPYENEDRIESINRTGTFKDSRLNDLEPPENTEYIEGEDLFDDDF